MVSSKRIAMEFHITAQTVRQYARDGVIPYVETPGGHRRFELDEVRAALRVARAREFAPLRNGEPPRVSDDRSGTPIQTTGMIGAAPTRASGDDAAGDDALGIPFIGVRGSSRFVVGPRQ
jgi:hypothetical protein